MDSFKFDTYWEAISEDCKSLIEHIALQVSHKTYNDPNLGAQNNEYYEWGGDNFIEFIRPFIENHRGAFGDELEESVGVKLDTLRKVSTKGVGEGAARKSFCFAAYEFEKRFSSSVEQFLIGFINFTSDYESHITFKGFEKEIKAINKFVAESGGKRIDTLSETDNAKVNICNTLSQLIKYPANEDTSENTKSLSPYDQHSYPFIGRKDEIVQLDNFLSDPAPYKLQFIIAPSGAGKTRLISHWFRIRENHALWQAGIATNDKSVDQWRQWALKDLDCDTLIVVDYTQRYMEPIRLITDKGMALHQKYSHFHDENTSVSYPRLRLILIDHVLPKVSEFETLPMHLRGALGDKARAVDMKLEHSVKAKDIFLSDLNEHGTLLRPIIAQASGLHEQSDAVEAAYQALVDMDKAIDAHEDSKPEVYSRFPLFAILIGNALKEKSVEEIRYWKRSQLIGQYFSGDRLPWLEDKELGQITGMLVAVATLLQGVEYETLFTLLTRFNIPVNEEGIKTRCCQIISFESDDYLKKYEPDILGETFCLMFFYEHRRKTYSGVSIKDVFFKLLSYGQQNSNEEIVANQRFIESIQRMARNLSNDAQKSTFIKRQWDALVELLSPENHVTPDMKFSVFVASMKVIRVLRIKQEDVFERIGKRIMADAELESNLSLFFELNQDALTVRKEGHAFHDCLSALTTFFDTSIVLGLFDIRQEQKLREFCLAYQEYHPSNNSFFFLPSFFEKPDLLKWMRQHYSDADIDKKNNQGWSPLLVACYKGSDLAVAELLTVPNINVNEKTDTGFSVLMAASHNGHVAVVSALLAADGIEVNQPDNSGWSALMFASQCGHVAVVAALLAVDDIEINQPNNEGYTALIVACLNKKIEVVKCLTSSDKKVKLNQEGKRLGTSLMVSCRVGELAIVEHLIKKDGKSIINQKCRRGNTSLMVACKRGNEDIVEFLLEQTTLRPEIKNRYGETAFMLACNYGRVDIVKKFLCRFDSTIVADRNSIGVNAFGLACSHGNLEVVELLVKECNASTLNHQDRLGNTAFMAACSKGDLSVVELLLLWQETININQNNRELESGFMLACREGYTEVVSKMLSCFVDLKINQKNANGETALMLACCNGHLGVVRELLKCTDKIKVNSINRSRNTAFMLAIKHENLLIAKEFLNSKIKIDFNNRDKCNYNVLEMSLHKKYFNLAVQMSNFYKLETLHRRFFNNMKLFEGENCIKLKKLQVGNGLSNCLPFVVDGDWEVASNEDLKITLGEISSSNLGFTLLDTDLFSVRRLPLSRFNKKGFLVELVFQNVLNENNLSVKDYYSNLIFLNGIEPELISDEMSLLLSLGGADMKINRCNVLMLIQCLFSAKYRMKLANFYLIRNINEYMEYLIMCGEFELIEVLNGLDLGKPDIVEQSRENFIVLNAPVVVDDKLLLLDLGVSVDEFVVIREDIILQDLSLPIERISYGVRQFSLFPTTLVKK